MAPHPLFAKFVAAGIARRNEIARSAGATAEAVAAGQEKTSNLN
jgi:hypothetical protein